VGELHATLDRLAAGRQECVALVGEAGIGKTKLLDLLCDLAAERGYRAARGRAIEFERDTPYGAVVHALNAVTDGLDPAVLDELGAERLAELAGVFPALDRFAGALPPSTQAERFRVHYAVEALLRALAAERPLVVALDDLHWADQASLELVGHLLRRQVEASLLLALSYRPRSAPPVLSSAIAAVAREQALVQIPLGPLARAEADELLGEQVPRSLRRSLYADSGGNPLLLIELARAAGGSARREARQPPGRPDDDSVPPQIEGLIEEEMAALSPAARAFGDAAAVLGEPFVFDQAAEVAGQGHAQASSALDELLGIELVRPGADWREFLFRHPIVRRAIYTSISSMGRLTAHARAADVLERHGEPLSKRAHHIERSAVRGDAAAFGLLTEAGHAAAPRAPDTAARWFRAALRLLPPAGGRAERLALLIPLAAALSAAGHHVETRSALLDARELLPSEQDVMRARILGAIARIDHTVGRPERARSALDEALAQIPDPASPAVCMVQLELAVHSWLLDEFEVMQEHAALAREGARRARERRVEMFATSMLALAAYSRGDMDAAAKSLGAADRLVLETSDEELAAGAEALAFLGMTCYQCDRLDLATDYLARALRFSRATGQAWLFAPIKVSQANTAHLLGRLDDAAAEADAAFDAATLTRNDQWLALALGHRCWADARAGDVAAALQAGEKAVEVVGRVPNAVYAWFAHCSFGCALIEAGEHERGRQEILAGAGGLELPSVAVPFRPYWYGLLAWAEDGAGRPDAAGEWVERAERLATHVRHSGAIGDARRARARLLLARGAAAEAEVAARDAVDHFDAVGRKLDSALARTVLGRAAAAGGERERAVVELTRAAAELAECGATRSHAEAKRDLRRLGVHIHAGGARAGRARSAGELTPREVEVAELVARGETNRQIAKELFLSERTIEKHVSSVLHKLGVSSRVMIPGELQRRARRA
jgi:DNA-binding CsgD family transcriptional regulator